MEIGAYFQVYKQPQATYRALHSFRASYPTGTVVLVSDNGLNFSNLAKQFNCIYFHETRNTNVLFSPTDRPKLEAFFERLRKCIPLIKEEYFLLLEDDVLVLRRILEPFHGTVNGNFFNSLPKEKVRFFRGLETIQEDFNYTGHGGSIVKTKEFVDMIMNKELVTYVLDTWDRSGLGETMGLDSLISVLTVVGGGTLAYLPCKKDYWTEQISSLDGICILHQMKDLYSTEKPDENAVY